MKVIKNNLGHLINEKGEMIYDEACEECVRFIKNKPANLRKLNEELRVVGSVPYECFVVEE